MNKIMEKKSRKKIFQKNKFIKNLIFQISFKSLKVIILIKKRKIFHK